MRRVIGLMVARVVAARMMVVAVAAVAAAGVVVGGGRARGQTVVGDGAGAGTGGAGGLAGTVVTLDLHEAPAEEALGALNRAAGTNLTYRDPVPREHVTLHVDKRPLMEVLLQMRQQLKLGTPSNQTADALVLGGTPIAEEIGTWCVAGPFGFVVNGIGHTLTLGEGGKVASETFGLRVQIMAEPAVHILGMPQGFVVSEAADEKGLSLLDEKAAVKEGFTAYPNPVLSLPLKHPAEAGRRIAVVKAKASILAMLKSETVTIKDPLTAEAVTKTAGGCKFTVGPLTTGARGHELKVTMEQGTLTGEQWTNLQTAMKRVAGAVMLGGDRPRKVNTPQGTVTGTGATATVAYNFATTAPRGGTAVEITELTIELPADVRAAEVPVEFHDLPLP